MKVVSKRIKHELDLLADYNIETEGVFNHHNEMIINIYPCEKQKYYIKFTLSKEYPFNAPKVVLFNLENNEQIRYTDHFVKMYNFYKKEKKIKYDCPCCYNLICEWQLQIKLIQVVHEIQQFDERLIRFRSIYYSKYLKQLDICEDVINVIVGFL